MLEPGGETGSAADIGGSLPWTSELFEAAPGKVRSEMRGVVLVLSCIAQKTTEGSPPVGDGDADSFQALQAPTVCVTTPANLQAPLFEKGTQIGGPLTSSLRFDAESGKLHCKGPEAPGEPGAETPEIEFTAATTGQIQVMTFEGQELVLAR